MSADVLASLATKVALLQVAGEVVDRAANHGPMPLEHASELRTIARRLAEIRGDVDRQRMAIAVPFTFAEAGVLAETTARVCGVGRIDGQNFVDIEVDAFEVKDAAGAPAVRDVTLRTTGAGYLAAADAMSKTPDALVPIMLAIIVKPGGSR